jgi:hypothetical protein
MKFKRLYEVYKNPELMTSSEIRYAGEIFWKISCYYYYIFTFFLTCELGRGVVSELRSF